MSDLTVTELRLIATNRNIKGYRSLYNDEVLINVNKSGLSLSELKLTAKFRRVIIFLDSTKLKIVWKK